MLRIQHLSNQGPPLKKPPLHQFLTKTTSDFIPQFDSDWPFQNSHCGKPGRRQHFPTPGSDRPLGKPQLHNPSTAISSAYADLVFPTTTLHDHRLGSAIRETPVARSRIETGSALNLRRCMRRNEPVPVSDRPLRKPQLHNPNTKPAPHSACLVANDGPGRSRFRISHWGGPSCTTRTRRPAPSNAFLVADGGTARSRARVSHWGGPNCTIPD